MSKGDRRKKAGKHYANKNNLQKTDYAKNILRPAGSTPIPTREMSSHSLQGTNEIFDSSDLTSDVSRSVRKGDIVFNWLRENGIGVLVTIVIFGAITWLFSEVVGLKEKVAAINEKLVSIEKEIENISVEKADEDIVGFQIESIKMDIQEIKDEISEYAGSR